MFEALGELILPSLAFLGATFWDSKDSLRKAASEQQEENGEPSELSEPSEADDTEVWAATSKPGSGVQLSAS